MTPWTLSLRSLACKNQAFSITRARRPTSWLAKRPPSWSYSTALQRNLRDDYPCTTVPYLGFREDEDGIVIDRARAKASWNREYDMIRLPLNVGKDGHEEMRLPILDIRAIQWAERVAECLDKDQSTLNISTCYFEPRLSPERIWTQVTLWLLSYDPQKALQLLLATHGQPYIPDACVAEVLRQLAAIFLRIDKYERATNMSKLADAFCEVAVSCDGRHAPFFMSNVIAKLLPYCSDEQVHRVYQAIQNHKIRIHAHTYMRFTSHFATNDAFLRALNALSKARELGKFDVNGFAFRSVCSTVLRRSIAQAEGLRETLRIVSTIVDMGVQLDNPICDIIMLNAVEAGDLNTAFSVYHSLVERGLKPTERTFAVLLKGCKANIDDAEMLNNTVRDAIANINVRQSRLVASNILHCLALHHSKHHPENALQTLTEAYAQLFDLSPLRRLGLPIPTVSQQRLTDESLMAPDPNALNFMIGASINHTLSLNPDPKQILPLYERWRQLVEAADPDFAPLATTDYTANIFLAAFIRKPNGLLHAAKVVRDMQRTLPPPCLAAGLQQCKPTQQSFSIFLHGFTRHKQLRLAEQVLNYMRAQGMEPTLVTWNTLITGYARMQDVEGTLDALRRGEQAGVVWNEWTNSGLKRLRDKRRLQDVLEGQRLGRELDFTQDIKQGLGERLQQDHGNAFGASSDQDQGGISKPNDVHGFSDSPADLAEQIEQYRPFD